MLLASARHCSAKVQQHGTNSWLFFPPVLGIAVQLTAPARREVDPVVPPVLRTEDAFSLADLYPFFHTRNCSAERSRRRYN
jgi:hypothetical protein